MKILILTEGGSKIGFGHLTRCIALYEAFKERDIYPEFIVNGDDAILGLLKNTKYLMFNWLKEADEIFSKVRGVNTVIVDSYLAPKPLYNKISQITDGRLLMIDDYNRIKYPEGIVVNPSLYGDRLNYPEKNRVAYLLGKDYIILRKEFWDVPEKIINEEVKSILITFGGMNHSGLAYKIVEYFKNKFNFKFQVTDTEKNKFTVKQMLDLMLNADICISGGGQTTYELARVGVPTIGICFAENQKLNLKGWQKNGFIEYLGWWNNKDLFNKLSLVIKKLEGREIRLGKSQRGRSFADGKGVNRLVNALLKLWR